EKALTEWRAKTSSAVSDERVHARMMIASWAPEVDILHSRVDQLSQAFTPFKQDYDEAKKSYDNAQFRLYHLQFAIRENPYIGPGQDTVSYGLWREFSFAAKIVLMENVRGHYEYDSFLRGMDDVASMCGYSTKGLEERQRDEARKMARNFFPAIPNLSDSIPMKLAV